MEPNVVHPASTNAHQDATVALTWTTGRHLLQTSAAASAGLAPFEMAAFQRHRMSTEPSVFWQAWPSIQRFMADHADAAKARILQQRADRHYTQSQFFRNLFAAWAIMAGVPRPPLLNSSSEDDPDDLFGGDVASDFSTDSITE